MGARGIYTASWQDKVMIADAIGESVTKEAKLAAAVNDLRLPIVKGYGSERSWVLPGTESLQTFGGSGFLQAYPIEQYVRDAKIDTLYEVTTAIQGQAFFFRTLVQATRDRKSVVSGKRVSVRVDFGCRLLITTKTKHKT